MGFSKRWDQFKLWYKQTGRKRILISHGICLAIAIYFACAMYYGLRAFSFSLNPITLVKRGIEYGIPWVLILFFFALNVMIYLVFQTSGEKATKQDPRNFTYSESGVYGTAGVLHQTEMEDVALIQTVNEARGTILGQLDRDGKQVINQLERSRYNKHVSVMGASQSGKSFCYAIPFVLQAVKRRESIIITDPKGELYRTTAELCRKHGYVVKRFDLNNMLYSDGWDCAKELLSGDMELRAQIFAHTAIMNADIGENDIYVKAGEALLKAVLLRVMLGNDYNSSDAQNRNTVRGPKTFAEAYKFLQKGREALAAEFDQETLLKAGALAARGPYTTFETTSANLGGNIIATVIAGLQLLQNRIVQDITSTDDIDLTLPGKRPCVYYVLMSDQHSTFDMLGGLFFSFAFLDLVEFANSQPGSVLPCPVNFLLDEFANYFQIPDFDKKVATVRSRAINISIICQDLPQLQKKYPETWASILSNCATHLCIGFNDLETEEYYSKRSGEATVKVKTEQHEAVDPFFAVGYRHSSGDGRRAVYTTDELARMDKDKCLVVFQGHSCFQAYKFTYPQHPFADELIETPIDCVPARNPNNLMRVYHDAKHYFDCYEDARLTEYELYEMDVRNGLRPELPQCKTYRELMDEYVLMHPEYLENPGGDWMQTIDYTTSYTKKEPASEGGYNEKKLGRPRKKQRQVENQLQLQFTEQPESTDDLMSAFTQPQKIKHSAPKEPPKVEEESNTSEEVPDDVPTEPVADSKPKSAFPMSKHHNP